MSQAQRVHFLQDVFQMTTITLVSIINHYHINGLHLFWDTQYVNFLLSNRSNDFLLSYLPNPSARAGYDKRSIFKRSLTGLNSEFSFS